MDAFKPTIKPKPLLCKVINNSGSDLFLPPSGKVVVQFPTQVSGIPVATFKRYLKQVANDICEYLPLAIRSSTLSVRANVVIEESPKPNDTDPIITYTLPSNQHNPHIARVNFNHWSLSTYAGEPNYKGLYHIISHIVSHRCGSYHHEASGVLNPHLTLIHRSFTDNDVAQLCDIPKHGSFNSLTDRRGSL